MRGGGFGRQRYEKPLPGQQFHSYEDAIYPPRAYRYHTQQAVPVPAVPTQRGGGGGSGGGSSNAGASYIGEPQTTTPIVLPTIDADAACGPFLRSGVVGGGGGSGTSASASSAGFLSRSTVSATPSNGADGMSGIGDAERRPPPRLQHFFDCFVPDEEASDVQSLTEVWRHMEPLNPFHYRELWGGIDGVVAADAPGPGGWAKAETTTAEGALEESAQRTTTEHGDGNALKAEDEKSRSATTTTTRAAQNALRRTLRAVGLPDELSSMVLLSARIAPGACPSRAQEKLLRLRAQRRPAPPRPIRRGAKVFVQASAVLGGTGEGGGGAGLVDVSALGPRVLRAGMKEQAAAVLSAVDEFAFDDDDDARSASGRGRRAGLKRGRHSADRGGDLEEGDLPLSELARWGVGAGGAAGNGVGGAGGAGGAGGSGAAAGGGALGHGDEEAEEELDEEDDISGGVFDDDDDENVGSEDGNDDGDSFGGGGGGGGDYGGDDGF